MKILLLTPQVPYPPDRGTALRNWGLLAGLAARHEVSLLTFVEPGQDPQPAPLVAATHGRLDGVPVPVRGWGARLVGLLRDPRPDLALRLAGDEFAARLRARLAAERYDVVQIEGLELATALDAVAQAAGRPLTVFDAHNAEWILQQRAAATDARDPRRWHAAAYSAVQWRRLRRFEGEVCRRAGRVVAVSAADAAALQALAPGRRVHVVPNGIDLASYAPGAFAQDAPAFDLLFTGKMDYRPNVDALLWFAATIWPRVRAASPEATLGVVGRQPHPRLDALRALPGVTVTGAVPDVRPYVARAGVYVAPLRMGGGTRFKLLEAMALSRAIVSTTVGAEGLGATGGRELLLADRPDQFAQAVVALLRDPARRVQLGASARAHVAACFDWSAIVPLLEAAYEP
jgi:sugar transferase (PEP-CTERM/EpsH1 system associated)